jgi:hypothetical protein
MPCGADARLRERERRDRTPRAPGKVAQLLLIGSEQLQRLRQPDRLMRREERSHVRVVAPDELHRALVLALREPETAVLRPDLHPERADFREPLEHLGRVLAALVDRDRVHVLYQEQLEPLQEGDELWAVLRV